MNENEYEYARDNFDQFDDDEYYDLKFRNFGAGDSEIYTCLWLCFFNRKKLWGKLIFHYEIKFFY